jgi:hypothetical protein
MNDVSTYLNDHLAGAVAALELLDHLIKRHKGKPLGDFLKELEQDVEADVAVLRRLIGQSHAHESFFRKAAAWLAEKLARSKFKAAGDGAGGLGLVQALETIELGIRGKQLLWRALACANWPQARDVDLAHLERRAVEQQARIERERAQAAHKAFAA